MTEGNSVKPLRSMVGQMIIVRSPVLHEDDMIRVRLHAVEPEGVWVESQAFTEKMMDRCGVATSISTLLMFIPFARIDYVVGSIRAVSLSEEALGLSEDNE